MADPRFFSKSKSFSVAEIAQKLSCTISNAHDADLILDDVSPLNSAAENHLSFLDNVKYKDDFKSTKAGACFVSQAMVEHASSSTICLVSDHPYKSYALAAQLFYPENKPEANIAANAYIDPTAKIGEGAHISHGVYIGAHVEIGEQVWIEPNAIIHDHVIIGDHCRIGSHTCISHAIIHNYVRTYPGSCIGQDGFGFAIDPAGHIKVPQLGRVIIHDHVQIGANTTIDRGAGPDTIIGQGTWIDNLVQIGHNVEIGRGCIIVAQVGISGSTKIADYVAIGGQAGIAGHLHIGMGAQIAAKSGVMKNISPGEELAGSPAMPKRQYFRQLATLNRLINNKKND